MILKRSTLKQQIFIYLYFYGSEMQGAAEVGGSPKTASHQAQGNNHLRVLLGLERLLQAHAHGCCQEALLLSGTLRRQPESPHTQIVGWLLQSEWSSTEWAAPHTLYDSISKSHTITFTFFCPFEEVQPTASGRGLDKGRYHRGLSWRLATTVN